MPVLPVQITLSGTLNVPLLPPPLLAEIGLGDMYGEIIDEAVGMAVEDKLCGWTITDICRGEQCPLGDPPCPSRDALCDTVDVAPTSYKAVIDIATTARDFQHLRTVTTSLAAALTQIVSLANDALQQEKSGAAQSPSSLTDEVTSGDRCPVHCNTHVATIASIAAIASEALEGLPAGAQPDGPSECSASTGDADERREGYEALPDSSGDEGVS